MAKSLLSQLRDAVGNGMGSKHLKKLKVQLQHPAGIRPCVYKTLIDFRDTSYAHHDKETWALTMQLMKQFGNEKYIRMLAHSELLFVTLDELNFSHFVVSMDLLESIRQQGIISPIYVKAYEGKLLVIDGNRRAYACEMLGVTKIPAYVCHKDELCVVPGAIQVNLKDNLFD